MKTDCAEYREIQVLLALKKRLAKGDLDEKERLSLSAEVFRLEERLGLS
jgi:hypothetical protein